MPAPGPCPIVVVRRGWLAILVFIAGTSTASAQTTLRSVAASTVADEAVVTIEASAALPPPTVGAIDGPPRIFLDFAGVTPATSGLARTRDPRVRRVRVALNSATPPVTRVVIDLAAVLPHRVELEGGRALVFIGAGSPAAAPLAPATPETAASRPRATTPAPASLPVKPPAQPAAAARPSASNTPAAIDHAASSTRILPVPQLPPPMPDANDRRSGPRTPSASSSPASSTATTSRPPYRPPATPPPAKDIEKYRADANPLLDRFKLQLPLLEQMESLEGDLSARMPMAMLEFDRLREELGAIKPPETLRTQHDLVMQAARLATTAAQLRLEAAQTGNDAVRRNAASAAAGASLMLERVFAELGFNQNP